MIKELLKLGASASPVGVAYHGVKGAAKGIAKGVKGVYRADQRFGMRHDRNKAVRQKNWSAVDEMKYLRKYHKHKGDWKPEHEKEYRKWMKEEAHKPENQTKNPDERKKMMKKFVEEAK